MLLERGADVNGRAKDGASALFWACVHGHLEIVDLLLAAGADVNAARGDDDLRSTRSQRRYSAADTAISNGHVAIAKRLVVAGTSLDHRWLGRDIVEFAESCGASEFLEFLKNEWRLARRRN